MAKTSEKKEDKHVQTTTTPEDASKHPGKKRDKRSLQELISPFINKELLLPLITKLQGINKGTLVGQPQPAANADIFAALATKSLIPSCASTFRVMVAMSNSGTFSAVINGSQVVNFNTGTALTSSALYIFDMLVSPGLTVDFRYSATGGQIMILSVQELDAVIA